MLSGTAVCIILPGSVVSGGNGGMTAFPGGVLLIRVFNSLPDGSVDREGDVRILTDGIERFVPAGTDVEISRDLIAARVPQPSPEMAAERETQKKLRIGGWIAQAPAAKAPAPLVSVSPETARRRILVRRVLMAAAVLFIVLGIFNGSMKDVLIKAIKICTECVGLG